MPVARPGKDVGASTLLALLCHLDSEWWLSNVAAMPSPEQCRLKASKKNGAGSVFTYLISIRTPQRRELKSSTNRRGVSVFGLDSGGFSGFWSVWVCGESPQCLHCKTSSWKVRGVDCIFGVAWLNGPFRMPCPWARRWLCVVVGLRALL